MTGAGTVCIFIPALTLGFRAYPAFAGVQRPSNAIELDVYCFLNIPI